ncbi:patatin-like phospholipase family protein [Pseudoroseomonas wenyumeiae]
MVSATRVSSGEARLFRDTEVTVEVLLASACLPQLFPAVEIEGEFYWDGGFASNPPLRALIEAGAPADMLLVRTTPQERPDLPAGDAAILERTEEMTFGAALRQEAPLLALAQRLLADLPSTTGVLARLRDARLHVIGAEEEFRALKIGSHQDASWAFLQEMRELGHSAAERWLASDFAAVGLRSTFDLSSFARPSLETPLGAQPATTTPPG